MAETRRIIPAEKIKTDEEFRDHKANYDYCINEQEWYAITKDPKKEVMDRLKEYLKKLDKVEHESTQEQAILKDINMLQIKLYYLSNNKYDSVLKENISTELKLMREYELGNKYKDTNLFSRLLKRDEEVKEFDDYKILRFWGRIGELTRLDVMPNSIVLLDFVNMYKDSFTDIDTDKIKNEVEEQLGLVVYEGDRAGSFGDGAAKRVQNRINDVIIGKKEQANSIKQEPNNKGSLDGLPYKKNSIEHNNKMQKPPIER